MEPNPERTDHNESNEEDAAAYALGSLAPADAARFERHLAGCAACQATLRDYAAVADLLPLGLPTMTASERSRSAVAAGLRGGRRRTGPALAPTWPRFPARPHPAFAWAAAAALILLVLWGSSRVLPPATDWRGGPAAAHVIALSEAPTGSAAVGQLVHQPGQDRATLIVSNLAPLAPDRAYQFWFVRPDASRVSGGAFRVDGGGTAVIEIAVPEPLASFQRVGLTEEPAGGSPAPTGPSVLGGVL